MNRNFIIDIETFALDHNHLVIREDYCFPGMVGESVDHVEFYTLNLETMKKTPHTFEQIREIYKNIGGKYLRVKFWKFASAAFPSAIRRREDSNAAAAIARVI